MEEGEAPDLHGPPDLRRATDLHGATVARVLGAPEKVDHFQILSPFSSDVPSRPFGTAD